jgi:hypothetical protein
MFAAVDSKIFHTCNLEIYAGRQPDGPFQVCNKSTDVVERLVALITNSGRNVCADNCFSDMNLLRNLSEKHRLSYVGTLKKNKWQIPKEMKEVKTRVAILRIFAYRKEGAEPHESDVASTVTEERKDDTPLGCSGGCSVA